MATFPTTLPLPLSNGHDVQPISQTIKTAMDRGNARVRRRTRSRAENKTLPWKFSLAEYDEFVAWLYDDDGGAGGAAWASFILNGVSCSIRFSGDPPYDGKLTMGGLYWLVTAKVEVRY